MKSENIQELAKALSAFQGELQSAKKDAANPFFKSSYASLPSVVEAAKELLKKHGFSICQTTEVVGERVCLVTTLMHSSGQWIDGTLPLNAIKGDPQAQGSAITYARRYAYAAILGVVTEDDDGEAAMGRTSDRQQQTEPPQVKTVNRPAAKAINGSRPIINNGAAK